MYTYNMDNYIYIYILYNAPRETILDLSNHLGWEEMINRFSFLYTQK